MKLADPMHRLVIALIFAFNLVTVSGCSETESKPQPPGKLGSLSDGTKPDFETLVSSMGRAEQAIRLRNHYHDEQIPADTATQSLVETLNSATCATAARQVRAKKGLAIDYELNSEGGDCPLQATFNIKSFTDSKGRNIFAKFILRAPRTSSPLEVVTMTVTGSNQTISDNPHLALPIRRLTITKGSGTTRDNRAVTYSFSQERLQSLSKKNADTAKVELTVTVGNERYMLVGSQKNDQWTATLNNIAIEATDLIRYLSTLGILVGLVPSTEAG